MHDALTLDPVKPWPPPVANPVPFDRRRSVRSGECHVDSTGVLRERFVAVDGNGMKIALERFSILVVLTLVAGCADLGLRPVLPLPGTDGKFNGWKVRDAVAAGDAAGITLTFSWRGFDRYSWFDDARFTADDLHRYLDNDDDYAPRLDLRLNQEGRLLAYRFGYVDHGVFWRQTKARSTALTIIAQSAGRIAGTLRLDDGHVVADIDFDLPLRSFGPLQRPGSALPEDGGEPGRWLLARSRAVWEGDLDGLLALMAPTERAGAVGRLQFHPVDIIDYKPGDIERSGVSLFMLKQRMDMPFVEAITGGSVDGNTAWVDFVGSEGVIGHDVISGTAVLGRDRRGRWSVQRVLSHESPERLDQAPGDDGESMKGPGKAHCVHGGTGDGSTVCFGANVFINGERYDAVSRPAKSAKRPH